MLRGFGLVVSGVLAMGSLSQMGSAQTDPYTYYGGEIETEVKNAAIEACEYRVLIEEQRCNRRANKTSCIKEVHSECREEYADKTSNDTQLEKD